MRSRAAGPASGGSVDTSRDEPAVHSLPTDPIAPGQIPQTQPTLTVEMGELRMSRADPTVRRPGRVGDSPTDQTRIDQAGATAETVGDVAGRIAATRVEPDDLLIADVGAGRGWVRSSGHTGGDQPVVHRLRRDPQPLPHRRQRQPPDDPPPTTARSTPDDAVYFSGDQSREVRDASSLDRQEGPDRVMNSTTVSTTPPTSTSLRKPNLHQIQGGHCAKRALTAGPHTGNADSVRTSSAGTSSPGSG